MTIGTKFAQVTPLQWLVACAFWAIALALLSVGYQAGKAVGQAHQERTRHG